MVKLKPPPQRQNHQPTSQDTIIHAIGVRPPPANLEVKL